MNKKEIVKIAKTTLAEFTGFDSPRTRNISKENKLWKVTINITEEFFDTLKPEILWTYDVLIDLAGNFRGLAKIRERKTHKSAIRKPLSAKNDCLQRYLVKNTEYSHL